MGENRLVTVCDWCLRASCWQNIFPCERHKEAGTLKQTVAYLRKRDLEHESYWEEE